MTRSFWGRLIMFSTGVVFACSSNGTGPRNGSGASGQIVGPGGGTVTAADGTEVIIPPGALGSNVTITIATNDQAPPLAQASALATAHLFGPEGQTFLKPVQVVLGFSGLPSGVPESAIVMYTAPQGSTTYAALSTSATDSSHVMATTTHFSNMLPGYGASDAGGSPDGSLADAPSGDSGSTCGSVGSGASANGCSQTETCGSHTYVANCTNGGAGSCTADGTTGPTTYWCECGTPPFSSTYGFACVPTLPEGGLEGQAAGDCLHTCNFP